MCCRRVCMRSTLVSRPHSWQMDTHIFSGSSDIVFISTCKFIYSQDHVAIFRAPDLLLTRVFLTFFSLCFHIFFLNTGMDPETSLKKIGIKSSYADSDPIPNLDRKFLSEEVQTDFLVFMFHCFIKDNCKVFKARVLYFFLNSSHPQNLSLLHGPNFS